jgi:hypothetical protein
MPFLNLTFLLRCKSLENFPKVPAQLAVNGLSAAFGGIWE